MSIVYTNGTPTQDHLSLAFFEEVVENATRRANLKVNRVTFAQGSSAGENYCSQIFRVHLEYAEEHREAEAEEINVGKISIIIKSMPKSEAIEFLEDLQVFLKEKITYYEVLPRMNVFLDGGKRFSARLYHHLKSPVNTLVFEDLSARNFELASREQGLDENHSRLVMQRLGEFHAISMVLAQKDPEILGCYEGGILSKASVKRQDGMLMRYFGGNLRELIGLVAQWPGYEQITAKLESYAANMAERLVQSQAPLAGELRVLNHGDLWVNNIMFQYDGQRQPQDLVFVDFQMGVWGSPGIDLNYFFYTSIPLELLKHRRVALLESYHRSLCETLRRQSYAKLPSFKEIQAEVERRESYGFFASYGIFPAISMDKTISTDSTLDNFLDEDFARKKTKQMFASKRLEDTMRYTLRRFEKLGIWD